MLIAEAPHIASSPRYYEILLRGEVATCQCGKKLPGTTCGIRIYYTHLQTQPDMRAVTESYVKIARRVHHQQLDINALILLLILQDGVHGDKGPVWRSRTGRREECMATQISSVTYFSFGYMAEQVLLRTCTLHSVVTSSIPCLLVVSCEDSV